MSLTFGDRAAGGCTLEPGVYDAVITSAAHVMDRDAPRVNQSGKEQVDVAFDVSGETAKRRYAISFGKNNQTGQFAGLAVLIQAATGVKCGDKDQRTVSDQDLIGKSVRIVLEENGDYINVTNVMPASKNKPSPKPQASGFGAENDDGSWPEGRG